MLFSFIELDFSDNSNLVLYIFNNKNKKLSNQIESNGAAGGIRIPDLSVRSRVLYPAKLLLHIDIKSTITL